MERLSLRRLIENDPSLAVDLDRSTAYNVRTTVHGCVKTEEVTNDQPLMMGVGIGCQIRRLSSDGAHDLLGCSALGDALLEIGQGLHEKQRCDGCSIELTKECCFVETEGLESRLVKDSDRSEGHGEPSQSRRRSEACALEIGARGDAAIGLENVHSHQNPKRVPACGRSATIDASTINSA